MPESSSLISAAQSISELSASALLVLIALSALFLARMFYMEKKETKKELKEELKATQTKYEDCLKTLKDK